MLAQLLLKTEAFPFMARRKSFQSWASFFSFATTCHFNVIFELNNMPFIGITSKNFGYSVGHFLGNTSFIFNQKG